MDFFQPIQQIDYSLEFWNKKYQPTSLDQIAGNPEIIRVLQKYLTQENIPNLILTGPPGVGKKISVRCLVKAYLGVNYQSACLEVDGSVSRGKDVVSEKKSAKKNKSFPNINMVNFIKKRTNLPAHLSKIIIIYDFDHMTNEAQMALRRIIETQKVRFIFVSNDYSNIIEAIQSRCNIHSFQKLTPEEIKSVLVHILELENVTLDQNVLDLIVITCYGDLKQSINYIQTMANSSEGSVENFYQIFSIPYLSEIKRIFLSCAEKDSSTSFQILQKLVDHGYYSLDLLDILLKVITLDQEIQSSLPPILHTHYLEAINKCFYLTENTGSIVHLYRLIAQFIELSGGFAFASHTPTP